MPKENRDDILNKYRELYRQIGKVICPAFPNEYIYFNRHGLNHLLRKRRKLRKFEDQIRRLKLLPQVIHILSRTDHIASHHRIQNGVTIVDFWKISGNNVHIIIRRTNKKGITH